MPKADGNIDTAALGLALSFFSPGKHNGKPRNAWKVQFDTGVVMFVPPALFESMTFHLQEKD